MSSSGPEFARLGMDVQRASVLSTDVAKVHGISWSDPAKLEGMAKLVLQYQLPTGTPEPKISELFTNQFAGQIKFTDSEWAQAKRGTAGVEHMLRSK
jgi:hypothetical protein